MGKTYSSLEKVINLMEAGLRDIKQVDPNDDSERIGRSSIHKSENTSDRVRSQLFNDLKKAENSHLWNNTEEVLNRIFDVVPELKKIYDNDYYGKIEDIEGKVPKSKQKFVIDILSNNRNLRKVLEPNNTNTPFENGMNKGIDSYVAKPNGENSDVEKELRLAEFKKLISTETSPKELVKILKQYPEYNKRGYITRLLSNTIDDEATIQHILKASGLGESADNIGNTLSECANRYMPVNEEGEDDVSAPAPEQNVQSSYTKAIEFFNSMNGKLLQKLIASTKKNGYQALDIGLGNQQMKKVVVEFKTCTIYFDAKNFITLPYEKNTEFEFRAINGDAENYIHWFDNGVEYALYL